jgi:methyl-accepting chemotaxis protein
VADEVRTLAVRTQESTEKIQTIIQQLQGITKSAGLAMNNIKVKSDICLVKVEQTSSHLGFIVEKVETASAMNTSIATAAEEQSVVVTGINQNVNAMSQLMIDTTENGNELASASAKLLSFTEEMNTVTEQFKVS